MSPKKDYLDIPQKGQIWMSPQKGSLDILQKGPYECPPKRALRMSAQKGSSNVSSNVVTKLERKILMQL